MCLLPSSPFSLFLIISLTRPLAYPFRRLPLMRGLRSQYRLIPSFFSQVLSQLLPPSFVSVRLLSSLYLRQSLSTFGWAFFAPPSLLYHTLLHDIMHSMVLRPCRAFCCCRLCAAPGLALLPLPGWASLWQSCALSTLSSLRQAKIC